MHTFIIRSSVYSARCFVSNIARNKKIFSQKIFCRAEKFLKCEWQKCEKLDKNRAARVTSVVCKFNLGNQWQCMLCNKTNLTAVLKVKFRKKSCKKFAVWSTRRSRPSRRWCRCRRWFWAISPWTRSRCRRSRTASRTTSTLNRPSPRWAQTVINHAKMLIGCLPKLDL